MDGIAVEIDADLRVIARIARRAAIVDVGPVARKGGDQSPGRVIKLDHRDRQLGVPGRIDVLLFKTTIFIRIEDLQVDVGRGSFGNLVDLELEAVNRTVAFHFKRIVGSAAAIGDICKVAKVEPDTRVRFLDLDELSVDADVVGVTVHRSGIDWRSQHFQVDARLADQFERRVAGNAARQVVEFHAGAIVDRAVERDRVLGIVLVDRDGEDQLTVGAVRAVGPTLQCLSIVGQPVGDGIATGLIAGVVAVGDVGERNGARTIGAEVGQNLEIVIQSSRSCGAGNVGETIALLDRHRLDRPRTIVLDIEHAHAEVDSGCIRVAIRIGSGLDQLDRSGIRRQRRRVIVVGVIGMPDVHPVFLLERHLTGVDARLHNRDGEVDRTVGVGRATGDRTVGLGEEQDLIALGEIIAKREQA